MDILGIMLACCGGVIFVIFSVITLVFWYTAKEL